MYKCRKSQLVERHIRGRRQYDVGYNVDSSYIDLKDNALLLQGSVCEEAYSGERVIPRWL